MFHQFPLLNLQLLKKSCSQFKTYPIVQQHDNRVRYKFYKLEHFLLFYVTNANYLGLKMSQIISMHIFFQLMICTIRVNKT
jgi:hypothetical protein